MGQIRQINGVYYIEFHARGLLYSQVAGNSLENAQKLLIQVEQKIAGGEALTITRYIDLPDFFERFLADARERADSPRSIERFAAVIGHFNGFIARDFPELRRLDQLTPAVIEGYKDHLVKTQKIKVVNFSILLIRDILEFGIKLGFINDNPSLHVRLLPWPRMRERRSTARHQLAGQLLSKGVSLSKLGQLLKLSDISKGIYFADMIPLSREDVHG